MPQLSIVDTQAVEWENGLSVYENMAPAWREHLGPKDKVMEMLAMYNQKTLRIDPVTTRRCDLIWLAPGYIDVTHAYHGSVEECFLLEGGIKLNGEGSFEADDYFWRPPGWGPLRGGAGGGARGPEPGGNEPRRRERRRVPPHPAGGGAWLERAPYRISRRRPSPRARPTSSNRHARVAYRRAVRSRSAGARRLRHRTHCGQTA